MAVESITFTITLEYDSEENGGMPANNFLYHYVTRLNREVEISAMEYKGATREFDDANPIEDIPLKVVDSIDEADRPEAPDMSEVTLLPEGTNPRHDPADGE